MNQTPNMPVPPTVENKNRNWVPWVVACILGLAAIGAFTQKEQTPSAASTPATSAPAVGNVGSSTEPTSCIESGAYTAMKASQREMEAATDSAYAGDVNGMERHLHSAADYQRQAATYVHDTPQVSDPLLQSADLVDQSADAVGMGDFTTGTTLLQQATATIDRGTTAVENYGEAC
jgi:hypothetical protein